MGSLATVTPGTGQRLRQTSCAASATAPQSKLGDPATSTQSRRRVYRRSADLKVYRCSGVREESAGIARPPLRSAREMDAISGTASHAAPFRQRSRRLHHVIALCPTCHRRVHHGTTTATNTTKNLRARSGRIGNKAAEQVGMRPHGCCARDSPELQGVSAGV